MLGDLFRERGHTALWTDSQSESKTPFLDNGLYHPGEQRRVSSRKSLHWLSHAVSAVSILGLLAQLMSQPTCWDKFNYYSPVNDAVAPYPYIHKVFNGSLWHKTPWTGPPTEEVERAWYEIVQYGMIGVSEEDISKIQHSSTSARFPDSSGGGYIAATIGTHHLHCLHYIWQDHYMSQLLPAARAEKERIPKYLYELHYEHCVDYIRQGLMCQFDTGIIPYSWVRDHPNPTPNANTHHKCVDWAALQDWLRDRAVVVPDNFTWMQPEDAVPLPWNP
ncbi:hypothetical protein F5Y17DRAFT_456243 [Xylariaceae sp. FL0594]|nr:hypothetical protein F5Y17DRAFT_456243 [Xylariaceae sp. FL0594]